MLQVELIDLSYLFALVRTSGPIAGNRDLLMRQVHGAFHGSRAVVGAPSALAFSLHVRRPQSAARVVRWRSEFARSAVEDILVPLLRDCLDPTNTGRPELRLQTSSVGVVLSKDEPVDFVLAFSAADFGLESDFDGYIVCNLDADGLTPIFVCTDPKKVKDLTRASASSNPLVLSLVRIVKQWNYRYGKPFSSLFIEVRAGLRWGNPCLTLWLVRTGHPFLSVLCSRLLGFNRP